jgi:hypothetical protein
MYVKFIGKVNQEITNKISITKFYLSWTSVEMGLIEFDSDGLTDLTD